MCYVTTTFTGSRMHNLTFFFNCFNNIFQHPQQIIDSFQFVSRRSSISTTGALKIEFLMYGYKKKSHGVRSQNVGGHSCGIFKLIRWLS
jgi:hypothetical protein